MREVDEGVKVRVLLAQALFGNPDILLLDEPTNGLDLASISWLEEFLIEFPEHRHRGVPRPPLPERGVHAHLRHRLRPGAHVRGQLRLLVPDQPHPRAAAEGRAEAPGREGEGPEGVHPALRGERLQEPAGHVPQEDPGKARGRRPRALEPALPLRRLQAGPPGGERRPGDRRPLEIARGPAGARRPGPHRQPRPTRSPWSAASTSRRRRSSASSPARTPPTPAPSPGARPSRGRISRGRTRACSRPTCRSSTGSRSTARATTRPSSAPSWGGCSSRATRG